MLLNVLIIQVEPKEKIEIIDCRARNRTCSVVDWLNVLLSSLKKGCCCSLRTSCILTVSGITIDVCTKITTRVVCIINVASFGLFVDVEVLCRGPGSKIVSFVAFYSIVVVTKNIMRIVRIIKIASFGRCVDGEVLRRGPGSKAVSFTRVVVKFLC